MNKKRKNRKRKPTCSKQFVKKTYNDYLKPVINNGINRVKRCAHLIKNTLLNPSLLFETKWCSSFCSETVRMIVVIILFAVAGVILNHIWAFPNFALFCIIFTLILLIVFFTLKYFYNNMKALCAEVTSYQPFVRSNHFYLIKTNSSFLYIVFPLFFVLAFGIGGTNIYSYISFTPTLIWVLAFFVIVVYFSMLAYMQYIRYAIYLHLAANNDSQFGNIIAPEKEELPPKLKWLVRATKISHALRNMFFVVGALYILAFAIFCFSGAFGVKIGAGLFYFLWSLIFVFIVLVFPFVTAISFLDIKRLVAKTKNAYIHELLFEEKIVSVSSPSIGDKMASIVRNYCISIILNTQDYPIKGGLTAVYSVITALINLSASIATIMQYQGD